MLKHTSISVFATAIAVTALAAQLGCKKEDKKDTNTAKPGATATKTPAATASGAKTTTATATTTTTTKSATATKLLALKFHHDN